LFSAWDVNGNGAVIKEDFLFAMQRVGLKSNKQSSLNALVDALDVDGDGDVSFVELCDGLMRRMQQAKEKHADDMRRQREKREKAAKKKKR
jgi:Ca2+-binding EF-hand superfamily protein